VGLEIAFSKYSSKTLQMVLVTSKYLSWYAPHRSLHLILALSKYLYFGRKIKLAGDRTFADWTVTVINDEDFLIRNALEQWSNQINSLQGNLRTFGGASPSFYKANATVTQVFKDWYTD